jgi:acyl-CoA thioester hydrolase
MTAPDGCIVDGEHVLPLRVYYEDTDAGGIVYYANYLKFAERGRTEMLRALGVDHQALARDHGLGFVVRGCSLDCRRPARLDDLIEVRSRLLELGGASMEAEQLILRDGIELVGLRVRLACTDQRGRAARMPPALRAALAGFRAPAQTQNADTATLQANSS